MPIREQRYEALPEPTMRVVGRGVSFPLTFSSRGKSQQLDSADGVEKVNQSIHQILSTRPGERIMVPEFGSKLPDLIFEPEDDLLYDLLYYWTVDALRRWEPRIDIIHVTIFESGWVRANLPVNNADVDASTVGIGIEYVIRSTHVPGSYIYPFQLGGMPHGDMLSGKRV